MNEIPQAMENTSGQGASAIVPPEIKGWSWAAFLMNWIWTIGMQTWIGLIALVPIPGLGLVMSIMLGMKGNEWAWQNRRWESVEQFKKVQRIWTRWGVGLAIASVVIGMVVSFWIVAVSIHEPSPPVRSKDVTLPVMPK